MKPERKPLPFPSYPTPIDQRIRTDCDDWAWVVPADEHVIIRFEVKSS